MREPADDVLLCVAALLEQGRTVDRLSRPLTAAALAATLVYPLMAEAASWTVVGLAAAIAIAGLAEAYVAVRVGFDAALFRQMTSTPERLDFARIDAALIHLRLLPAHKAGRATDVRIGGAKRLFAYQILALTVQILSVFAGAALAMARR